MGASTFSGSQTALPPAHATPPPPARLAAAPPAQWFGPEALRQAWRAVQAAGGGPGVDGVTLARFAERLDEELAELGGELRAGVYRPRPPRQVWVPKRGEGLRPLLLWALRDRIAQRAVYEILSPCLEPHFLPCSFGFRPGLGVDDAVQQLIAQRDSQRLWVVDGDIRACFESIDCRRLLRLLRGRVQDRLILRYVAAWLDADILTSADGRPQAAGVSQGGVLSPLLANLYLHEFDGTLTRRGLTLLRYADDFVICCRRRREAESALRQAGDALARLRLELHPDKSRVVHFDQGFRWLGYFFVRRQVYRL